MVAHELLVEALGRASGPVARGGPEAGGVRGQDLVDDDEVVTEEAELEFGVSQDHAARRQEIGAEAIELEGGRLEPPGGVRAHEAGEPLPRDVLVVALFGLGGGGEDGLRQAIGLAQARGQLVPADRAGFEILLPAGTGQVSAHHAFGIHSAGFARQSDAAGELLAEAAAGGEAVADLGEIRRYEVVGKERGRLAEPEGADLSQDSALAGDGRGQDLVEGREAVRGHDEQALSDVVDGAGFASAEEGEVGNGQVNGVVFLATILVSIATAAVSGIVPALRASGLSPVSVLKDEALSTSGGLSKSRLSSTLVVAQVALSLLLLTCAGLFIRSLLNAQKSDPGFDPNHVLLISFDLDPMGYSDAKGLEFERQLVERVKQLPGVQSATLADFSPLSFTIHSEGILPEGYVPAPHQSVEADRGKVGPGYLQTMRTPLLAGRDFTEQDNAAAQPVAIVNQALVDRYWPGQNAIGKHIDVSSHSYTVVGVAANGKYRRMTYDAAPLVLLPLLQRYDDQLILHVRTSGDPLAQASAVEQTIQGLNPDLPVYNVTTLKANMQMGNVFERIAVTFAGAFGLLALLLAAVGIYGVVAYTTRQRTHEIGIRMALGAGKQDVFRQVLGQGLRLTFAGLAVGLVVSFAFTRFLRGMLFGVGATDWLTFTSVAVLLCMVALAACLIPARRAASVEPMQALRTE